MIRVGPVVPVEIDQKRFYLPQQVFAICPKCGAEVERDGYLSYPKVNQPMRMTFWHHVGTEEHEWDEQIVLRVTIEAAP